MALMMPLESSGLMGFDRGIQGVTIKGRGIGEANLFFIFLGTERTLNADQIPNYLHLSVLKPSRTHAERRQKARRTHTENTQKNMQNAHKKHAERTQNA